MTLVPLVLVKTSDLFFRAKEDDPSVPNSRLPEAVVELLGYLSARFGNTGDA